MTILPIKSIDQAIIDMYKALLEEDTKETLAVIQSLGMDLSSLDLSMPEVKQNTVLSEDDAEIADIFWNR